MPMLNIFDGDEFGVVPLTDAINEIPFVPGRVGEMGIFSDTPVATLTIALAKKGDEIVLVAPSPRGTSGQTVDKKKADLRSFIIPHFQIDDAIMADEVQGVRAWDSESEVETVMGVVAGRMATHNQSMEATLEYSAIGAVKGIVTYADGSTLNLFTEFGVSQEAEIDFDLDNATPVDGELREKCAVLGRKMAENLGGLPHSGIHCFAGDNLFDNLLKHPEVRATYKGWTEAQILRDGYISPSGKSYSAFEFGGIVWENYRGKVGNTGFVDTDKAHFFPVGVPNLFRTYYGPADYVETVNTLGQRIYMKQWLMPNNKGINIEVQSNALKICTRPKALMKGKRT
ncbi:major capsid protein [Xanthobacter sp. 91]|uniref:major capsid protein n=1 Tax=Xanthobacter sp. 91 TaxID=1117244 RepID=UPI000AAA5570|nr:major capsid protein [Xanthobacter sp. 91]